MSISSGEDIVDSDFINESQRDATPANDVGRVAKLESDGEFHEHFLRNGIEINAGETINGATLPVPVYIDTSDNEAYACDGNDTATLRFVGFAISDSTNGNPIRIQTSGVVGGFSGLTEGSRYYLQDTVGTIGTSVGTYSVLVGVAISSTKIEIKKGVRRSVGVATRAGDANTGTVSYNHNLGLTPNKIKITAVYAGASGSDDEVMESIGTYSDGSYATVSWSGFFDGSGGGHTTTSGESSSVVVNIVDAVSGGSQTATVSAVSETQFTLSWTEGGSGVGTLDIRLMFEVEADY